MNFEVNDQFENLFREDEKYVFLVGAGVSMNPPSNLPSAQQFVKVLLEYCVPKSFENYLFNLKELRYELMVEEVQRVFDPELKFLDFLDSQTDPNLIHFFLAQCILKRHNVITTNFDYLIEHALLKATKEGLNKKFSPIISKSDYIQFHSKIKDSKKREGWFCKIHGSKKNIFSGENTQKSLITTISSLGKERESGKTFAIEAFKKPAILKLTQDRNLIIIGYSGSDDFDIGPALKELLGLKSIIWIEHYSGSGKAPKNEKVNNILQEIHDKYQIPVHLIQENTENFIKSKIWHQLIPNASIPELKDKEKDINAFKNWAHSIYENNKETDKYDVAGVLLGQLNQYEMAIKNYKEALNLAEKENDMQFKAALLTALGVIFYSSKNLEEAEKVFSQSLALAEKQNVLKTIVDASINLSNVKLLKGKLDESIQLTEKSLIICENLNMIGEKLACYSNLAQINQARGNYDEAIKYNELILKQTEQEGDLFNKLRILNNIGHINHLRGNYQKALEYYDTGMKLTDQLGDTFNKISILNNIGSVHIKLGDLSEAFKLYSNALKMAEEIGDKSQQAVALNNISVVYQHRGDFSQALTNCLNTMEIVSKLGLNEEKVICLGHIGEIYLKMGETEKAISHFKESLEISENLGLKSHQAKTLNHLGQVQLALNNIDDALEITLEALKIVDIIGEFSIKAPILTNLGQIYLSKGSIGEALRYQNEALEIADKLHDLTNQAIIHNNLAAIYFSQGNVPGAVQEGLKSLEIFEKQGNISEKSQVLINIANGYHQMRMLTESLQYLEKGLIASKEAHNDADVAFCHEKMGEIYRDQGNYNMAIQNFNSAVNYYDQLQKLASKGRVMSHIAFIYEKTNKLKEAIEWYSACLDISDKVNKPKAKLIALSKLSNLYEKIKDVSSAIKFASESQKLAEELNELNKNAEAHELLARLHFFSKEVEEAKNYLIKGLELAKKIPDANLSGDFMNNMGYILLSTGEFLGAARYFWDALEVFYNIPNTQRIGLVTTNFMRLYDSIKKTLNLNELSTNNVKMDSILQIYEFIIKAMEKIKNIPMLFKFKTEIANLYKVSGDFENAYEHLEKAKEIASDLNNNMAIAESNLNLGLILYAMEDLKTALKEFNEAAKIDDQENKAIKAIKAKAIHGIGMVYLDSNDKKKALKKLKEALKLYNIIGDEENSKKVNNLISQCKKK